MRLRNEREFDEFTRKHELKFSENGLPYILLNRRLVSLGEGTAFGEVALLSNVKRMASVKTTVPTLLATITRHEFSTVLRKAMKRKQQKAGEYLRNFAFFEKFTSAKI